MKQTLLILMLGWPSLLSATAASEPQAISTTLDAVTVYLEGAQLLRTGSIRLPSGESEWLIKGLSPTLDPTSLQVKGTGAFTLISVNHELSYSEAEENRIRQDQSIATRDSLVRVRRVALADLEVLEQKLSFIEKNQLLQGDYATIENWRQALAFYDQEYSKLKHQVIDKKVLLGEMQQAIERLDQQIGRPTVGRPDNSWVRIKVRANQATTANFTVQYFVPHAGWNPNYDIRVENTKEPLRLEYKAQIYQNTGEDWNDVALTLTNYNPNQSGQRPLLYPWTLGQAYQRVMRGQNNEVSGRVMDSQGEALSGVTVLVEGTAVGVITDESGAYKVQIPTGPQDVLLRFSYVGLETQTVAVSGRSVINVTLQDQNIAMEDAVIIRGLAGVRRSSLASSVASVSGRRRRSEDIAAPAPEAALPPVIVEEATNAVRIQIEDPYSLASGAEPLVVGLQNYDLNADYRYYATPRLDPEAFLVAELTDWKGRSLMEGMANLFIEGTFQGQTLFDPRGNSDTLSLSLGRDRSIQLERVLIEESLAPRYLAARREETREYEFRVTNQKNTEVQIVLLDQVPLSPREDVEVIVDELSRGELDETTGFVTWEFTVPAQNKMTKRMKYRVRLPRRSGIQVE